ncbi:MAG: calcium-binding protein [Rhodobacteraceae bacterium]|nr:calcium-binding protein [Paracoccaceae bacterium]
MADFAINTTVTTGQTLGGSDIGVIGTNGAILLTVGTGVSMTGDNDLIINGLITTAGTAVNSSASSVEMVIGQQGNILCTGTSAVSLAVSISAEINNAGAIMGSQFGMSIFGLDNSFALEVINSGTISATFALTLTPQEQEAAVINSGLISGTQVAIHTQNLNNPTESVLLVNTGTVSGGTLSFVGSEHTASGDRVLNSGLMQGNIVLNEGNDIYHGKFGTISGIVFGGAGEDNLKGGAGDDEFDGGDDNDLLVGRAGNDELTGGVGNDTILGNDGDDTLFGGSQSDVINGGRGNDEITTGGGDDVIVFKRSAGNDTLTDFNNGRDVIDLQAFNLLNWNALNSSGAVSDVSGGVEIDFSLIGGSGILTIEGITVALLGGGDFVF